MSDDKGAQGPAPDDEFDRELRELATGAAPAPLFQEPSAAERAKAGAAQAMKARKAKKDRKQGRRGQWAGSLILVIILAVAGGITWLLFGHSAVGLRPNGSGSAPSAGSASPAGTASPANLPGGPPGDPFAGTPADGWADGAAGIVTPPARPTGGFTAAQGRGGLRDYAEAADRRGPGPEDPARRPAGRVRQPAPQAAAKAISWPT
jgi:hypothetical protein